MKSVRIVLGLFLALGIIVALLVFNRGIGDAFRAVRIIVESVGDRSFSYDAFQALTAENERLTTEVDSLRQTSSTVPLHEFKYRQALAYSRYPLNDRERFMIDLGSEDGLMVGAPVFVPGGVLVGRVNTVQRTRAEVLTIFDPEWRSSVLVGTSSVKAALTGGNPPKLGLIPQDVPVAPGDAVTNVSPDFPMGAVIGTVKSVERDVNDVWRTATIDVPYREDVLGKVLMPLNFP